MRGERRIGPLIKLIWIFLIVEAAHSSKIQPRWSCYHHHLAGISTSGVYPIAGFNSNSVSNIKCLFENGTIYTEIHSALDTPYQVMSKKSVNFQIADIFHLKELVRHSVCQQTLSVNWKNVPETERGAITVVSLLNESSRIEYNGEEMQYFFFNGPAAGVRHLIPDENDYDSNPTVSTTRLLCQHHPQSDCLFHGRIEIDLEPNLEWSYTFAFRTDATNQTLFSLRNGAEIVVRLENDYFMRIDGGQPFGVGQLSDAVWHTVVVKHSEPDRHFLKIDNLEEVELLRPFDNDDDSTTILTISVSGDIQLIDATDSTDDCLVSFAQHKRRLQETVNTGALCSDCDCPILTEQFDGLNRCVEASNQGAYHIHRDLDRLSFLYFEDAFEIDANGAVVPKISVAFKSDSDSGLVLFGYWQNSKAKGRLQVYFHYDSLSAVYCQNRDDEECIGCSINNPQGFGREEWIQTILWGGIDDMYLAVDKSICRLQSNHNISLAEVYAIPQFAQGSGMFVGGTWHEKKRQGLYRSDVEQKYFENTREKAPVLRGCVKNVFTRGTKLDLDTAFEQQKEVFLTDSDNSKAFSITSGCPTCTNPCQNSVRCRPSRPLQNSPMLCDCADNFQFNATYGTCDNKESSMPIVLSNEFLSQPQIVVDVHNTKAILSKVWLKFALPKQINEDQTIVEFNSHREKLFNIRIDTDGYVNVQVQGQDDEKNAARQLSLDDDRVHLLQLQRRSPVGTRHAAKKYDLYIDGYHTVVSDIGKLVLNNLTINAADTQDEWSSVIIHDFGLGYDYDEHFAIHHTSNVIHQIDIHRQLVPYQLRLPDLSKTGILDDSLWQRNPITSDGQEPSSLESSPFGQVVDYTADIIEPEQLLSSRWILYSLFLTVLLCLLILVCIICYFCVIRRRTLRHSTSERTIMRDSPDYSHVKLRPESVGGLSLDTDGSIGTDDTDLQAYRDIPSHRVKIYRESMVSILVPSIDQPAEAAIVKRSRSTVSDEFAARPTPSPNESQIAPLVQVNDD